MSIAVKTNQTHYLEQVDLVVLILLYAAQVTSSDEDCCWPKHKTKDDSHDYKYKRDKSS